jgi:hypothetical protein
MLGVGILVALAIGAFALIKSGAREFPASSSGAGREETASDSGHVQSPTGPTDGRLAIGQEAHELRVLVTTTAGIPIGAAHVVSTTSNSSDPVSGVTSTDGKVSLAIPSNTTSVGASASGYVKRMQVISPPFPAELTIALAAEGCVSGIVRFRGKVPPCQTTVVAFPSGTRPSPSELSSTVGVHVGETDLAGGFELCGLSEAASWTLLAGCPGYATHNVLTYGPDTEGPVQLELSAYEFIAVACKIEGDGDPCLNTHLADFAHGVICAKRSSPNSKSPSQYQPIQGFLAGIPVEWCAFATAGVQRLLLQPSGDVPTEEEFDCRAVFPGYELAWRKFQWLPLRDGFRVQTLELSQTAEKWGTVQVMLEGLDPELFDGLDLSLSPLNLALTPKSGGQRIMFGLADAAATGMLRLDCVPSGLYRWSVEPSPLLAPISSGLTQNNLIDIQDTGELWIDFRRYGVLEVLLSDPSGAEYSGLASLRVSAAPNGQQVAPVGFAVFERAPYRLLGLPAGEYVVALDMPQPASGPSNSTTIRLAEGRNEAVVISVSPQ